MLCRKTRLALTLVGLIASGSSMVLADVIRVEAESLPVPLHRAGASGSDPIQTDGRIEASGVEPIGDGRFVLVAHDKASEMYVVETATGRIVGDAVTSPAMPETSAAGPKWEGLARDSKGNFYAMGSHSGKTDEERTQRAHLVRFRFEGEGKPGQVPIIDPASVRKFDAFGSLASALGKESSEVGKLKVEGLAVRESAAIGGKPVKLEVVVGLREPGDLVRVFSAEVVEGQPLVFSRLFAFDAGLREGVPSTLTSLTYVPSWRGFFVLTATEDKDNAFHGNTLWFLGDQEIPTSGQAKPVRVHDFEVAMKAEGLADFPQSISENSTLRLVVAFDNDAKATHMPSRIQTLRLTRRGDRDGRD